MTQLVRQFIDRTEDQIAIDFIGDIVIDEYYEVSVKRISPEAPTPIMHSEGLAPNATKVGGVGNVACQLNHFNAKSRLISFKNRKVNECLSNTNIDLSLSRLVDDMDIPIKRRFLDKGMQINRWDIETPNYGWDITEDERESIASAYFAYPRANVRVLSDYDKGFFSPNQCPYITKDAITIVDPKNGPIERWKNCTIFKPNAEEAYRLSGYRDWKDQCLYFTDVLQCEAVIITHSGEGVKGCWKSCFLEYKPASQVGVQSFVGAGDCFIAFLAFAVAHGYEKLEAIEVAYEAGARYVQGSYNRPIYPVELIADKLVKSEWLANRDFPLIMANGCFDILHTEHIRLLKHAKSLGFKVAVALNSDDSVKKLKGPLRPVNSLDDRMYVIAALDCVDYVTHFAEETPAQIVKTMQPNAIIKGGDYKAEDVVGYDDVNGDVVIFPYEKNISTTQILGRAQSTPIRDFLQKVLKSL